MTQTQATRTLWVVNQFDLAQDQSIEIVDFELRREGTLVVSLPVALKQLYPDVKAMLVFDEGAASTAIEFNEFYFEGRDDERIMIYRNDPFLGFVVATGSPLGVALYANGLLERDSGIDVDLPEGIGFSIERADESVDLNLTAKADSELGRALLKMID